MTNIIKKLADENAEAFRNEAHVNSAEEDYSSVPLEEFLHCAKIQRDIESRLDTKGTNDTAIPFVGFFNFLKDKHAQRNNSQAAIEGSEEKKTGAVGEVAEVEDGTMVELENANRLVRNASWITVFYLITTDILGPTSAPYAISQLGFVPGTLLYVLFGICAAYTGWIVYKAFLALDSVQYPLRAYGDVFGRLYGKKAQMFVDGMQALQLVCNVAVIILGNGQGLYQIAKGKVCSAVLIVIWALAGMIVGQIRSLQRFGFLSNLAIWMNLFVCFATMGVVAHTGVNYDAALTQNGIEKGPIITKAVISGSGEHFSLQLQAAMNIVYAYGGAMVFVNFMAEMRRPMDFIKGMALAQATIFSCYLLYGLFVYAYQGQFTVNPGNQGINPYGWQTALNVISLVSSLIAAALYGNVGIKTIYNSFFKKALHLPALETRPGRIAWIISVIIYWALSYVIASAIPQFSTLTSLVGAVCILQFTYTFPPLIALGLDMQTSAIKADQPYDPVTKQTARVDSWKNMSRWTRSFKDKWAKNVFHIVFFLAAAATCVLGIYASAVEIKSAYSGDNRTAFSCRPLI
uniref:ARAD1A14564p n=1 Tax=Blastobotrys adeninivorans TaxID=409370 RepID=A0A060SYU6_BLAAD